MTPHRSPPPMTIYYLSSIARKSINHDILLWQIQYTQYLCRLGYLFRLNFTHALKNYSESTCDLTQKPHIITIIFKTSGQPCSRGFPGFRLLNKALTIWKLVYIIASCGPVEQIFPIISKIYARRYKGAYLKACRGGENLQASGWFKGYLLHPWRTDPGYHLHPYILRTSTPSRKKINLHPPKFGKFAQNEKYFSDMPWCTQTHDEFRKNDDKGAKF